MRKDTNYCCFLPQTREAMIKTNPEIWHFNLQSIDEHYLRFGQWVFSQSAVNQHGALSSPKKIQKPKNSKSSMKYSNTERSHTESLKQ